jgi:hypothetical protein
MKLKELKKRLFDRYKCRIQNDAIDGTCSFNCRGCIYYRTRKMVKNNKYNSAEDYNKNHK